MMQISAVLNGEHMKLSTKEAGKLLREAKAAGFRLEPDLGGRHYDLEDCSAYGLKRRASRYVTRNFVHRLKDFEVKVLSLTMYTADWFDDRH